MAEVIELIFIPTAELTIPHRTSNNEANASVET